MRPVYLDYSATTPLDDRVFEAMVPYFRENFGNASSIHAFGRKARAALEESRETIARCINAPYEALVFTSGGTESDNYAVRGAGMAQAKKGRNHIIVSAVEHHAVLDTALDLRTKGFEVNCARVDETGTVDLDHLRSLANDRTALISVMHVNNEVGTIEPVREAADIAHAVGALFHTDAVQSFGKIPVNVEDLGADLLTLSAHKIYGPKGIGALYIKKGTIVEPLVTGGGQEGNRRAGTESVALAVGFAQAARIAVEFAERDSIHIRKLRHELREKLAGHRGIVFNGHPEKSIPHILSVSFDRTGIDGEALIIGMDLRGVAVTSGSACTSGTLEPSHVLLAMGRPEATARATIRFSLGRLTTSEEIETAAKALEEVVRAMKKR
ncbi:MAG: cysteine desulfurase IscS [Bacteroidia bacterium]|nr:MAG: cysteine desulfurase IscS [Bacteroidia bacterium]